MAPPGSRRWAYVRVMAGTIHGSVLGFYVMHRAETSLQGTALSSPLLSRAVPAGKLFACSGSLPDFLFAGKDGGEAAEVRGADARQGQRGVCCAFSPSI
jgi:hypothetical protein